MIKLKDILQEKTYKTTLSTSSSKWVVYNMSDVLKINPIKVVKSEEEALKWKKKYQQHDKFGAYGAVTVKHWNKYVNAKKLKEEKLSEAPTYLEKQLKVISDGIDTIEGVISPLIRNLVVVDEHAVPQKVEMIKNLKNLQKYFKKLSKQRRSW